MSIIDWAERGWLPDRLVRVGIRHLLKQRLRQVCETGAKNAQQAAEQFATQQRLAPIVVAADDANEQHYEVPAEFFQLVLGKHLKYSSGYWPAGIETLDAAEEAMLKLTEERADLRDGQQILELGCGWGSLTLWMAARFPNSHITAVSNSASQKAFIDHQCRQRRLTNVNVITCNIAELELDSQFDRIVSVEMFEHVRNHAQLFAKLANWMQPESKLFVHIFCHRQASYLFEEEADSDWMTRHFFRGGMMPAENLLAQFNEHLQIEQQWQVNGVHYARTCEAWLQNLDRQVKRSQEILRSAGFSAEQLQRWRIFFMACAELFAYQNGTEWKVAHYLLTPARVHSRLAAAQVT